MELHSFYSKTLVADTHYLAVIRPGHHEAAVGQGGDGGVTLEIGRGGVDQEFAPRFRPVGGEYLGADSEVGNVTAGPAY